MVQSTAEVLNERGKRYGVFMQQAQIAQSIHLVLDQAMKLTGKTKFDFAPDQLEAINMIVNKIGRIYNGDPNYSDSWRDIAGYATLVADRLDNDTQRKLLESQNERSRNTEEAETNRTDNEPNRPEGHRGLEEDSRVNVPYRPTGRSELRRMPVVLEVQDGTDTLTSQTYPGVPGTHRQ